MQKPISTLEEKSLRELPELPQSSGEETLKL